MSDAIEFFFEFSSPFSYIASKRVENLAQKHGRSLIWKPFLLGAVFKQEGTQSLMAYPTKGPYSKRDIERIAAYYDLPFVWPPTFPILTVNAARAVLWAQDQSADRSVALIHALFDMAYMVGKDISSFNAVSEAAESVGFNPETVAAEIKQPSIKAKLKAVTDEAISRGVFGAPFTFVDGESFWGNDRLDIVDAWISRGGW